MAGVQESNPGDLPPVFPRPPANPTPAETDANAWSRRARAVFAGSVADLPADRLAALARARRIALAGAPDAGADRWWHRLAAWPVRPLGSFATAVALVLLSMTPLLPGEFETAALAENELILAYHGPALAAEEPDFAQWTATGVDASPRTG